MLKLLGLVPAAELSKLFYGPKVIDFARRRQNHFGKKFPQLVSRIACKPQTRFYRMPFLKIGQPGKPVRAYERASRGQGMETVARAIDRR
jgi:hypothetical protein